MRSFTEYWRYIRKEADEGRVYQYYRFVIVVSFLIGTAILGYLYFYSNNVLYAFIFFMLIVSIGITNWQSLWVAMDWAGRSEKYNETWRLGEIFIGTLMKKFAEQEKIQAAKENRPPRSMEAVAEEVGDVAIKIYQAGISIEEKMRNKKITIDRITTAIQQALDYTDDMQQWLDRLKKLMPLFETLADSVEGIDQKELGRVIGYYIAELMLKADKVPEVNGDGGTQGGHDIQKECSESQKTDK